MSLFISGITLLQPGIKIGISHTCLQRLSAWSINQTWDNIIENYELAYPICPYFTYYGLKYQLFIWKTCLSKFGKIIQNKLINWGPYGQFINTCSEWNITTCDLLDVTRMNRAENEAITGSHLLAWGDEGISDNRIALLTAPTAILMHIWKIMAALKPVQLFNDSFIGTAVSTCTYKFTLFGSTNVTACVPLPYVF